MNKKTIREIADAKVDIFSKPANIPPVFFAKKTIHLLHSEDMFLIINSFCPDNLRKKIA